MHKKAEKFLKILKIELDDLEGDIHEYITFYEKKREEGRITEYVYLENLTLLKQEIAGIHEIISSLNQMNCDSKLEPETLINAIDTMFREQTKAFDFPEAVYQLVKRKLIKVKNFIEITD